MTEVAEIFRRYGSQYREKYGERMPSSHLQVMWAIEHCRTEALGGHVYHCQVCEEKRYCYHSCRNRHCPKCQNEKGQLWLEKQGDSLLPVPYFMITFTLPTELKELARSHQKLFYNLLFRVSAAAAQKLALDPRFVGGKIGMVGVLHTWGRNLSYHPHVHYLVPAGALADDGETWLPARTDFLMPVKALSKLFRAKFRDALRKTEYFAGVPASVWRKDWVVHSKAVGGGLPALKYLAPYIFRVALSNSRILKVADGKVTFRYQDTNGGQMRVCTLAAEEFIRRFLQHVLPKGFVKVRYYGLLSPSYSRILVSIRLSLGSVNEVENSAKTETDCINQAKLLPQTAILCPTCGNAMQQRERLRRRGRCPP